MKTMIFLSLSLFILAGCNAPSGTRIQNGSTGLGTTGGSNNYTGGLVDVGQTTGGTTGGTTGSTETQTAGFESCDLKDKYTSSDLGSFGLCQSTLNETMIKFRMSTASETSRVCLVPTYKDTTGSSTWIGQPQCTYTTKDKVYLGTLYKNRSGFANYALNGVMVMKEPLLVSYFSCMDSYLKYIQAACPTNPTHPQCVTAANNYRTNVCNQFKTTYPSHYLDIRLK